MSARIGIALGRAGLTATVGEGADAREVFVPASVPTDGSTPVAALSLAFEELSDRVEGGDESVRRRVTVALLPPLTETKLLRLPPLDADEAEAVVRRTAARHFLTGGTPSVIGVEIPSGKPAAKGPGGEAHVGETTAEAFVMASAAPRTMAEAVYQAVTSIGWTLEAVVPAHAAWRAAADGDGEARGDGPGAPRLVVALHEGTAYLLRLDGRQVTSVRRLPDADVAGVVAAAGPGPGRVWMIGSSGTSGSILAGLQRSGWHPAPRGPEGSAARVAAGWAGSAGMELVPPRLAMERRDRVRRVGVGMAAVAVVLLVAAAGVQLWGANRELQGVGERRAEIADAVAPVLAVADELWAIEDRLVAIEEVQRIAGSWTLALVEISVALPDNVHLVGLQAAGDTLVIDAVGQRAGDALDALRQASTLTDVRQEGPIQYEVEGGAVARERFTLSALRVRAPTGSSVLSSGGGS